MVEYLKTKKGYFYKLLKNGEKKRISQEEYNRKNKKMIGGIGKSYKEIIAELKRKGKYGEWIKDIKFGKIKKNSSGIYPYTDVDNKVVLVNEVVSKYKEDPDIEYIAVFKYYNPIKKSSSRNNDINVDKIYRESMSSHEEIKTNSNSNSKSKTETEIIQELVNEKKYDKWVSEGRLFAVKIYNSRLCYNITDINGNQIFVSLVNKNFDPSNRNIAVLGMNDELMDQHINPYVRQGDYSIVGRNDRLYTFGLSTCCALKIMIGTKKFMAHIDTLTDVGKITNVIEEIIKNEGENSNKLKVSIVTGYYNLDYRTLDMAKTVCNQLSIPRENISVSYRELDYIVEA